CSSLASSVSLADFGSFFTHLMGFSECELLLELLEDADPAPAPCGPCAAALPAPNETPNIATAATTTSFFICPSDHSLRPNWRDPDGPRASVGHAVALAARRWRASTPPIGYVVLSGRPTEGGAASHPRRLEQVFVLNRLL